MASLSFQHDHKSCLKIVFMLIISVSLNAKRIQVKDKYFTADKFYSDNPLIGVLTSPLSENHIRDVRFKLKEKGLNEEQIKKLIPEISVLKPNDEYLIKSQGNNALPILYTDSDKVIIALIKRIDGLLLPGDYSFFKHEEIMNGLSILELNYEKSEHYLYFR